MKSTTSLSEAAERAVSDPRSWGKGARSTIKRVLDKRTKYKRVKR